MSPVKEIKHRLIDRILSSNDERLLLKVDQFMESQSSGENQVELTEAQLNMLEISDMDINNGEIISQEKLDSNDLEWLTEK
jgi:hypothetical protein